MSETQIVLLGVGSIGRTLLGQLVGNRRTVTQSLRVAGLIDRSGFVFEPDGLSWRRVAELRLHKSSGQSLATAEGGQAASSAESIEAITTRLVGRSVIVDATASDTRSLLETALARGSDAVLANKLPLSGAQCDVDRLHAIAGEYGQRILHEATVGAGLPVIDTLRKLLEAGDRILSIEGCPSGTLGYLFGELGRGRPFSASLRAAIAAGYTEPDPRTDLSGLDVARKALILARLIGYRGDLGDVSIESLVPDALADVETNEFVARVDEADEEWTRRVDAARAEGRVLRYRARVTRRRIEVGLAAVDANDPLSTLSGTDNQFTFRTSRYRDQPLVITGPGAGPAVTAAGIYNDLLRLVAERGATRRVVAGVA
jgi:aspartokinase/homoserine dehydrogenase 1